MINLQPPPLPPPRTSWQHGYWNTWEEACDETVLVAVFVASVVQAIRWLFGRRRRAYQLVARMTGTGDLDYGSTSVRGPHIGGGPELEEMSTAELLRVSERTDGAELGFLSAGERTQAPDADVLIESCSGGGSSRGNAAVLSTCSGDSEPALRVPSELPPVPLLEPPASTPAMSHSIAGADGSAADGYQHDVGNIERL